MKDGDFLAEAIRQLIAGANLSPAQAEAVRQAELIIRRQMGGERYYVQKAPVLGKVQRLAAQLAAGGAGLHEVFASAGVSRSSGYRLISRRR